MNRQLAYDGGREELPAQEATKYWRMLTHVLADPAVWASLQGKDAVGGERQSENLMRGLRKVYP